MCVYVCTCVRDMDEVCGEEGVVDNKTEKKGKVEESFRET